MVNSQLVDDIEGEIIDPLAKYLWTDEELNEYLEEFQNFEDKDEIASPKKYAWEICGPKDSGKTHQLCTSWELDKRNPVFKPGHARFDPDLEFLGHLLNKDKIIGGAPSVGLDMQGKFIKMAREGKFLGKPIKVKDVYYPAEQMATMQDPILIVEELVKFLRAADRMKSGTAFIEDNWRLTNVIQTYIQYWLRDRPEHSELPLGHLPKYGYEDWGIRNAIWDFIGGFWQRLGIHLDTTTPMEQVWGETGPTGDLEPKRYKQIPFYMDAIVYLWYTNDKNRGVEFWAQIQSSDYTESGTVYSPIKSPSKIKLVAQLCKLSHSYDLKQAGFDVQENGKVIKVKTNGKKEKTN